MSGKKGQRGPWLAEQSHPPHFHNTHPCASCLHGPLIGALSAAPASLRSPARACPCPSRRPGLPPRLRGTPAECSRGGPAVRACPNATRDLAGSTQALTSEANRRVKTEPEFKRSCMRPSGPFRCSEGRAASPRLPAHARATPWKPARSRRIGLLPRLAV
jgi:hypothetical protein